MPISPDQTGEPAPDEHTSEPSFVMVLNDGETFSPLAGCKIVQCNSDHDTEYTEDLIAEPDAALLFEFGEKIPAALTSPLTQDHRSWKIERLLRGYSGASDDPESDLTDAMADAMHYAKTQGFDPRALFERALMHFDAEQQTSQPSDESAGERRRAWDLPRSCR
jgi:hypothetical protein